MGLTLTSEQQHALGIALEITRTAGHMSLIGPAGCGKTTTIRVIAERVMEEHGRKRVLLLAPTHKARRQFEAGALAPGTITMTIHKFCKVKAEQWRDQERFKVSSRRDLSTIEGVRRKFALVIVDEASMVSSELAAKAVDICQEAGIGIMFAGDPYQLPPVRESVGEDEDGPDAEITEDGQAPEFLQAPVIVRLDKVLRHGGPILQFATDMRQEWDRLHGFPVVPVQDGESHIEVLPDTRSAFIEHFSLVHGQYATGQLDATGFYAEAPRALCYTNRVVNDLTTNLRESIYGQEASNRWRPGEIVLLPSYTTTLAGDFIHSSTDAIVIKSRIIDVDIASDPVHWKTPSRNLDRTCDLEFCGQVQELTIQTVTPSGVVDADAQHVIYTPLLGDQTLRAQYAQMRKSLLNAKPSLKSDHRAWQWLGGIKKLYLTPVTSAFVLTVHKSQGSTFQHVYVARDLLRAKDKATRNPLLYVAATRAAKSITFGSVNVIGA